MTNYKLTVLPKLVNANAPTPYFLNTVGSQQ